MPANWNQWSWVVFASLWTLMVTLSYWAFHPAYGVMFSRWPNGGMILTLLLLSGGAGYLLHTSKWAVRGWMIYGFALLLQAVVFSTYVSSYKVVTGPVAGPLFYFLGFSVMLHLALLVVVAFHIGAGAWVMRRVEDRYAPSSLRVLQLATGISVVGMLTFLLAALGWLKAVVLWPVVLGVLVLQRKSVISFLQGLLLRPVTIRGAHPFSVAPWLMVMVGLSIMQVAIIKAFPIGFDGAALYMNTAHLLADSGYLPRTGQSFNWELFMSQGEVLFRLPAVSILLSHGAMLFCLFALYRLARLFLSREASGLAVALLFLNPAFSFHAMMDEKVDLGFLFLLLATLLLLLENRAKGHAPSAESARPPAARAFLAGDVPVWALAGWLGGYAFGIKYTGLLAFVAILSLLFYKRAGMWAGVGWLLSALGGLFFVGVHRFGYLELDGTPGWVFGLLALVPGLALLVVHTRKDQGAWPYWGARIGVFGGMAFLCFLPWMVKHVVEHQSLSLTNLVQGKPRSARLDVQGFLARQDAAADLPEQVIVQAIKGLGVVMRPEQKAQVPAIVSQYRFDKQAPAGTRQEQLVQARKQVIEQLLDPAQQATIRQRLEATGAELETRAGEDARGTYDMLVQMMQRRGFQLSEVQQTDLRALVQDYYLQGKLQPGNRQAVMTLREEIFDQILDPRQKAQLKGLQEGDLRRMADGGFQRTTLFGGAQREEIKRYIGYEGGLPLYLSVPYDITMNTQIPFSRYLDISFLLLLLLPFVLMARRGAGNVLVMAGALLLWLISVYSLYVTNGQPPQAEAVKTMLANQQGNQASSVSGGAFEAMQQAWIALGSSMHGMYRALETLPFVGIFLVLLLLGAGGLLAARAFLRPLPGPLRDLLAFALPFGALWLLLGNAIVWYGFPFFALLFLLYAWLWEKPEALGAAAPDPFARRWWRGAVGFYLVLSLGLFFVSGIQPLDRAERLFQGPFLRYASQAVQVKDTYNQFMPYMDESIQYLNADLQDKIYRVGTYFHYHIRRNDRRVLEDNQLGQYEGAMGSLRNKDDFIDLLRESGFRYVLYDLNTARIDNTPDKTLTRKSQEFLSLLLTSTQVRPLYTDNFIQDPAVPYTQVGDRRYPGKPGIGGQVSQPGSFILFEIL